MFDKVYLDNTNNPWSLQSLSQSSLSFSKFYSHRIVLFIAVFLYFSILSDMSLTLFFSLLSTCFIKEVVYVRTGIYNPQPATYHRQGPRGQFKALSAAVPASPPFNHWNLFFFLENHKPDPLNWKLERTIGSGSRFYRVYTATRFKC